MSYLAIPNIPNTVNDDAPSTETSQLIPVKIPPTPCFVIRSDGRVDIVAIRTDVIEFLTQVSNIPLGGGECIPFLYQQLSVVTGSTPRHSLCISDTPPSLVVTGNKMRSQLMS